MPYIKALLRRDAWLTPRTSGDLNYALTETLIGYLKREGVSYEAINDCLGALEGAKLEFYRRVAVPYEEKKRLENGDVYSA